jgi:cell division protein FtsL
MSEEKTLGEIAYETWCYDISHDAWQAVADAVVAAHEARQEAAERERDVYHAALSEIYYRAIPLNEDSGHSTIAHIAADAMRGNNGNPFAARDARMKREGAVEAYGRAAGMLSVFPGGADAEEMMRDAAKRLREGK